jgi:hypothetical protein
VGADRLVLHEVRPRVGRTQRGVSTPACARCGQLQDARHPLDICLGVGAVGAFLEVLCEVCWHRAQYHAELRRRLFWKRFTNPGNASDAGRPTGA